MDVIQDIVVKKWGAQAMREASSFFEELCQQGSEMRSFLIDLLRRESEGRFFDLDHFVLTLGYKSILTEENSRKVSKVLSCLYPKEDLSSFPTLFSEGLQLSVGKAISDLREQGYHISSEKLPMDVCLKLLKGVEDVQFLGAQNIDTIKGFSPEVMEKAKGSLYRVKNQSDLLRKESFLDLSVDRFFLQVAQEYLESPPVHVQTNFWWTKAQKQPKERELNANAQLFHRDKEYIRFLKVFIYLNDVTEENGPHIFIPGSHISHSSMFGEGKESFRRFSEEELKKQDHLQEPISHTGRTGTIVFEDTYGFHRGGMVRSGHRLMFQLEYANSLYFRYSAPFDPGVKGDFCSSSSRIFSNYTNVNRRNILKKEKKEEFIQKNKARVRRWLGR